MQPSYYEEILRRLIKDRALDPENDQVLVVAGGPFDRETLLKCGFRRVTISNLDTRLKGDEFAPYDWCFLNAENLKLEDESFDVVMVHNGLHHCFVPQQAIAEMLRVARRGVLLFEPYDNLVTRIGTALKIGQTYETAAVFANDFEFGGVANTSVANFIYRFTRREIIKTTACAFPYGPAEHRFFHKLIVPWSQLTRRRNKLILLAAVCALPLLKVISWIFPTQTNSFAAWIGKPNAQRGWWPWLEKTGGKFQANRKWLSDVYQEKGQ